MWKLARDSSVENTPVIYEQSRNRQVAALAYQNSKSYLLSAAGARVYVTDMEKQKDVGLVEMVRLFLEFPINENSIALSEPFLRTMRMRTSQCWGIYCPVFRINL